MSETVWKHRANAPRRLGFGLVTCSSSRFEELKRGGRVVDLSGDLIVDLLEKAGHGVVSRKIVSDDMQMIREETEKLLNTSGVDAIILCGGTGITSRDVTIETVVRLLEKELPGFGEIFRRLSYDEIGSAAILTRALAGVAKGKVIYCIPGSPHAVRLCVEKLILPETGHIVKHIREKST
ncbi:MAG: molybdenum cofactor biosynthesis protein B [Candidatus Bathyarchaeia archaeon]